MKLRPVANPLDETVLAGTADSGLRVVVHPRPRDRRTFAAFGTNFGSVDRVATASGEPVPEGLAHFLEHKLFEDANGDVSDRFAELGASTNAMTGFVGTTYIMSTVDHAAESLALLLEFVQAPWFTDELVAKEQGIIAQEIRMYDDDPDWRVFFGLLGCLYERHPVRENIAGSVESISDIDAATLRRCYELFYHPRNMCLALSGALDPEVVAACVEADQGGRTSDGRGPHVREPGDEPSERRAERFELELPVARPRLLLGIKDRVVGGDGRSVACRELATRVLLDVLFGRSSAAFETLYGEGLIDESFSAYHASDASFGFATIGGDTDEPERLEARVRSVLEDARQHRLDLGAVGRVRNKLYGLMLRTLDAPEHVGSMLMTETFRGLAPFEELELVANLDERALQERLAEFLFDEAIAVAVIRPA